MAITPSSNLKILQGVPIDKDYNHTLYFSSKANQQTYFSGKAKYSFNDFTYIRDNKAIRINKKADNLYDCNYIMYQNENYSTKWFYAFITNVEYVNDSMSLIYFEQDYIQSWLLDCTLKSCFVDREHSVTDALFEHIEDEDIDCGDVYVTEHTESYDMNAQSLRIVGALYNEDQVQIESKVINNLYTPLSVSHGYSITADLDDIVETIEGFVDSGRESAIVTIYQYPSAFEPSDRDPSAVVSHIFNFTPNFTTFVEGPSASPVTYTPKNKKLFCSPYNQLLVDAHCGQTAQYKWENWTSPSVRGSFMIQGVALITPSVLCAPSGYLGELINYKYSLVYDKFPLCPWVGDTYKAWLAQNTGQIVANMANTASETMVNGVTQGASAFGGGLMFGNVEGGILNALTQTVNAGVRGFNNEMSIVRSFLGKKRDLEHTPPQIYGLANNPSLQLGLKLCKYDFHQQHIRIQNARQVDDYFTRFGYACKKVKVPNISSRPHWNFTKTVGCTITGDIPPHAQSAICQIFDNGITFWKNASEVGNYSLDNSPS